MQDTYIPGVCNIGGSQRRVRLIFGVIALIFTALSTTAYVLYPFTKILIAILIFSIGATLAFLQYYNSFCVHYGITGKYHLDNMNSPIDTPNTGIKDDRIKSLNIIILSILITILYTLSLYYIVLIL